MPKRKKCAAVIKAAASAEAIASPQAYFVTEGKGDDVEVVLQSIDLYACLNYLRRNLTGTGKLYGSDGTLLALQKLPQGMTVPSLKKK
jgi:hypothetical protein